MIRVEADIQNLPKKPFLTEGYIVARRDDAELWYWGFFEDHDQAAEVAIEINNGVILKVSPTMTEPGAKQAYFTVDDEKVYKNTPIGNSPDNYMTKVEIMMTKDAFRECLQKWGQ